MATTGRSGATNGSRCRARTAVCALRTTEFTSARPAGAAAGQRAPEFRQQPMPEAHRAGGPRRVAGPEDRGDQVLSRLVVKGQRAHQRQIAPVIIEAIEEGELLRAVGR